MFCAAGFVGAYCNTPLHRDRQWNMRYEVVGTTGPLSLRGRQFDLWCGVEGQAQGIGPTKSLIFTILEFEQTDNI